MNKLEEIDHFEKEHRRLKAKPNFSQLPPTYQDIVDSCPMPFLPLKGFEEAPIGQMLQEAESLAERMVTHRSDYSKGWKSIVLHGLEAHKTESMEQYGLDSNDLNLYHWLDFTQSMTPCIRRFFESHFHYEFYHRIRIMMLEPGGYILPHSDMKRFLLDPVNIALNQPPNCHFYFEDYGEVPFQKWPFIKLSLDRKHIVINRSPVPRFHIIVHGRPRSSFWQPLVVESYKMLVQQYG